MIAADLIADWLVQLGVRHAFGVSGANVEDLFAAIQSRRPLLGAVLAKHEFGAATMADGYARASGGLGVVLATSGGGALNLVPALAEAQASAIPILALVGQPPTALQGRGAFQDTSGRGGSIDTHEVFRGVSAYCARVERADELPRRLEEALAASLGPRPGPAVLLIPRDVQRAEVGPCEIASTRPAPRPPDRVAVTRAAEVLRQGPVVVLAGSAVARCGAREALARLVHRLDAEVAVTPAGRDAFDNDSPRFLGVAGWMGHPRAVRALERARTCLLVDTRLPAMTAQGLEGVLESKHLICVGADAPFVETEVPPLAVRGELRRTLDALSRQLGARPDVRPSPAAAPSPPRALPVSARAALDSVSALAALDGVIPAGAVVLVDAGNTGARAIHHLNAPRDGRWLVAVGMGGMGYTFGAAVGAALATGRRCFVFAGDGSFFMHGMEIHTALEHDLPITYVVLNNNAHGMCVVRERVLHGREAGHNRFRPAHIGAGLRALFPGLRAFDCASAEALARALAESPARGPAVVCAEVSADEVPPFLPLQRPATETLPSLEKGAADGRRRSQAC